MPCAYGFASARSSVGRAGTAAGPGRRGSVPVGRAAAVRVGSGRRGSPALLGASAVLPERDGGGVRFFFCGGFVERETGQLQPAFAFFGVAGRVLGSTRAAGRLPGLTPSAAGRVRVVREVC